MVALTLFLAVFAGSIVALAVVGAIAHVAIVSLSRLFLFAIGCLSHSIAFVGRFVFYLAR